MYSIHHYVIKFISDFRQVRGFVLGTLLSSTNKTDLHDMTKTLLKVALYPITLNLAPSRYKDSALGQS
jgi:hypothetical protein